MIELNSGTVLQKQDTLLLGQIAVASGTMEQYYLHPNGSEFEFNRTWYWWDDDKKAGLGGYRRNKLQPSNHVMPAAGSYDKNSGMGLFSVSCGSSTVMISISGGSWVKGNFS